MKSKLFFKNLPYLIIIILCILLYIQKNDNSTINEVISKDSIYTPIKINSIKTKFDTIKIIKPIIRDSVIYKENPVNKDLLKKFKDASNKLELYKKAIEENEYIEIFEDSIQKITVYSKTQGKLLEQSIESHIKEKEIPHYTTTITKTVIKKDNNRLFVGGGISIPTIPSEPFRYEGGILYKNKKNNIWSLKIDNKKNISIGYYFNIW